jgi:hypothetical protein
MSIVDARNVPVPKEALSQTTASFFFAAIRRASQVLILIKPPIKSRAYIRFNEPLGGGHEAFAIHLGNFRDDHLHRTNR